jgi:hypothetical protein
MSQLNHDEEKWKILRRRSGIFFWMWIGWIPYGALVMLGLDWLKLDRLVPYFLIPYMLAWAVMGVSMSNFPCPACGKTFFRKNFLGLPYNNIWTSKCLHCGVKKYS